ncbi:MAG: hypothetical protein AAGB10_10735 [Pseudomonadota bacterium]
MIRMSLVACAFSLTGCGDTISRSVSPFVDADIKDSVAQQIMGEGAISVYPFAFQSISAPGIYAVRANERTGRHSYIEICARDMQNDAIRTMEQAPRTDNRTYSDTLGASRVSVSTPFIAANTRYTLHSIDGFEAYTVKSNGSVDAADWILSNVGQNCTDLLPENSPYFVATGVAISSSINVESGGGIQIEPFDIGLLDVELDVSESGQRIVNSERVFAIAGKLFRDGTSTSHGAF